MDFICFIINDLIQHFNIEFNNINHSFKDNLNNKTNF